MADRRSSSPDAASSRGTVLTIAGLVLVALAAAVVFIAAPRLTMLPGSFESTVHYDGSSSQLNGETLKLGDPTGVTAIREVKVTETDGSTAIISSVSTAKLPTGDNVTNKTFAIDRTTYDQVTGVDDVDDNKGGMVLSHSRHPDAKDGDSFTVYDATTDTAQLVEYVKTETIDGRKAYYYEGETIAPVKAEGTLDTLRATVGEQMGTDGTELPAETVMSFVAQLPGSNGDDLRAAVTAAGDMVPAKYISTNTTKVWIDAELGSPLKTGQDQTISLYADLGEAGPYPLLDLNRLQLMADDDSVAKLVDTAASNAFKIKLISVYIPIGLAVLGLVLLAGGAFAARPSSPTASRTDDRELVGSSH